MVTRAEDDNQERLDSETGPLLILGFEPVPKTIKKPRTGRGFLL
jgi:hypothetical protein